MLKKMSIVFATAISVLALAACGNQESKADKKLKAENSSLKAANSSLKASAKANETASDDSEDASTSGETPAKASFKNKVLTTPKMTAKVTGTKIVFDEDEGDRIMVVFVDIKNTTDHDLDPYDEWSSYVTPKQKSATSNIELETAYASDHYEAQQDAMDNDVLAGKTIHAAQGYTLKNSNTVSLLVTDYDTEKSLGTLDFSAK